MLAFDGPAQLIAMIAVGILLIAATAGCLLAACWLFSKNCGLRGRKADKPVTDKGDATL